MKVYSMMHCGCLTRILDSYLYMIAQIKTNLFSNSKPLQIRCIYFLNVYRSILYYNQIEFNHIKLYTITFEMIMNNRKCNLRNGITLHFYYLFRRSLIIRKKNCFRYTQPMPKRKL